MCLALNSSNFAERRGGSGGGAHLDGRMNLAGTAGAQLSCGREVAGLGRELPPCYQVPQLGHHVVGVAPLAACVPGRLQAREACDPVESACARVS